MSAASGDAMPGDALYSAKRATEGARLALTTSDMVRGQLYLEFAGTRATEARAEHGDPVDLAKLLGDMDKQTVAGVQLLTAWAAEHQDQRVLDYVDAWITIQRTRLAWLDSGPGAARVEQSAALLAAVGARSARLRAALACKAGTGRPDSFGPVPGACPAPPASGGARATSTTTAGGSGTSTGGSGHSGTAPSGGHPSPSPSPATNRHSPAPAPGNPQLPPSPRPSAAG
jgi:Domain of unknown function (DUF5667)